MKISKLLDCQSKFYESGKTLSVLFRKDCLQRLYQVIQNNEKLINDALMADLHKSETESFMTETGMVLDEIKFVLKHLNSWTKKHRVRTPLAQFLASSFTVYEPYGKVLIMAPWNYPFQLCLEPLVGAVAAGNTVVLKPSAYAPCTSSCIKKIIEQVFDVSHVAVVEGGRKENCVLLEEKFDYIFFTGSVAVGKTVLEKASRNLTPVSLELGGKSPVIVDASADLNLAAKRIAFGKCLNSGQTCVAPDYLLIDKTVKADFLKFYKKYTELFFQNGFEEQVCIVNDKHFNRIKQLVDESIKQGAKMFCGGNFDQQNRLIEPLVLTKVSFDSPIMQEEIFGPVLPVIEYSDLDKVLDKVRQLPKPLALYLFSNDRYIQEKVLTTVSFGGGCINDTIIHLATPFMGFGGVGNSGMGSYHGKKSFETFSHQKSIVKKSNLMDLSMRYHPYSEKKLEIIRKFMG